MTTRPEGICARTAKVAICEQTARISTERFGERLRAVVLTGSLARDEATFVADGPRWRLHGDADFFLVFKQTSPLPLAVEIDSAASEITTILDQGDLTAAIHLAAVDASYLRGLPHHISPYELRVCGSVVWGDRGVLSLIPTFSAQQISLEDAWRLLANRILEVLEVAASVSEPDEVASVELRYRTVKLYLDMATSFLVFSGRYQPTYGARQKALDDLASDSSSSSDSPFPLRPFADRVRQCTRFKVDGRETIDHPAEFWRDAIEFARLLWRWELKRLTSVTNAGSDTELMVRWMEQQPVKARIRGWASAVRRCGWHQSWHELPRWIRLGLKASPRYWVYTVATEAFFHSSGLAGNGFGPAEPGMDWKRLPSRLPLPSLGYSNLAAFPWRDIAARAALNYRRLLETTTA